MLVQLNIINCSRLEHSKENKKDAEGNAFKGRTDETQLSGEKPAYNFYKLPVLVNDSKVQRGTGRKS